METVTKTAPQLVYCVDPFLFVFSTFEQRPTFCRILLQQHEMHDIYRGLPLGERESFRTAIPEKKGLLPFNGTTELRYAHCGCGCLLHIHIYAEMIVNSPISASKSGQSLHVVCQSLHISSVIC